MAYLHPVRLTFAGSFQADVSTVNNDVRHYDDAAFKRSYQHFTKGSDWNGWWNPTGSGAFRLVGCRVTSAHYGDGTGTTDPSADAVVGMSVTGAGNRTAGKLVDIDPQWQLASAPWGFGMRLAKGGVTALAGEYTSHAFRDLWFNRDTSSSGDAAASSTFQSVLTDVVIGAEDPESSRLLAELQAATEAGRLSVRMTTYAYDGDHTSPRFTLGKVVGTIGPCLAGEPESFVLGRRFAPANGQTSFVGISYFTGVLDEASHTLLLDLSNALQTVDVRGQPHLNDIGTLSVGVLTDDSVTETTPVTSDTMEPVGTIDYTRPGWMEQTSGIATFPLTQEQYAHAASRPLALAYDAPFNPGANEPGTGAGVVAIRETSGGLSVGAEPAVVRLDPGQTATVSLYAAKLGAPLDARLVVRQLGRVPGQGAGPPGPPALAAVPIPDIGVPESALTVPAEAATVGGRATIELGADDPGNPRGYLDGQIYLIDYRLPGQANSSKQAFEYVVVHVRDGYAAPAEPTWHDVSAVLTQFANLYPVMSVGFIDLADEAAVRANRDLLVLAFQAPITDPNHMPVTRDLSAAKRAMLLGWLTSLPEPSATVPGHRGRDTASPPPPPVGDHAEVDSKARFAGTFLAGGRPRHTHR
jgi:hypothetical protein